MGSDIKYAKLFANGQSQAVRLPKEFRFPGDRVRVKRLGNGVLLEPDVFDLKQYFAAIDECGTSYFMAEGREQPAMPEDTISFD
jgi:antitoxin VapB